MPRILTKQILRDAAARLAPGTPDTTDPTENEFMCHAVDEAGAAAGKDGRKVRNLFGALLKEHGVSDCGRLRHGSGPDLYRWCAGQGTPESQALRFDFLNLLAESL